MQKLANLSLIKAGAFGTGFVAGVRFYTYGYTHPLASGSLRLN